MWPFWKKTNIEEDDGNKLQIEKDKFKEEIINKAAFIYQQLADRYNTPELTFLNIYYTSNIASSLIMMDYLVDVNDTIFDRIKYISFEQAILLSKACGAAIMVMFLKNKANMQFIEDQNVHIENFMSSLTGSLSFDQTEKDFLNKMFSAWDPNNDDYYRLCSTWATHFYTFVLKQDEVFDMSERIYISGVLELGFKVFMKELNKKF